MNRLILIGNGFDLAHGLKTSYKDFIEYLWKGIFDELNIKSSSTHNYTKGDYKFTDSNNLIHIYYSSIGLNGYGYIRIVSKSVVHEVSIIDKDLLDLSVPIKKFISEVRMLKHLFSNSFFEVISQNYMNKNWSDIEADYYRSLKKAKDKEGDIKKLNDEFFKIKELLREYLLSLNDNKYVDGIHDIIFSPIKPKDLKLESLNIMNTELGLRVIEFTKTPSNSTWMMNFVLSGNRIQKSDHESQNTYITNFLAGLNIIPYGLTDFFLPSNILLLNFNYTKTAHPYKGMSVKNRIYNEHVNIQENHIHGSLYDSNNHMIFGYGDEDDDEYKELEKLETKGLLDNVKSINYLEASNYRDMERFIESAPYQIYIMGMSCGLADRTMLRKLFQHKNCISIKPYYYQYTNQNNVVCNNYTEMIQNISRCFSDKDLLRSLVVDKTKCEPLPQL